MFFSLISIAGPESKQRRCVRSPEWEGPPVNRSSLIGWEARPARPLVTVSCGECYLCVMSCHVSNSNSVMCHVLLYLLTCNVGNFNCLVLLTRSCVMSFG